MAESMPQHDLRSVAGHFQICGDFREAAPYGGIAEAHEEAGVLVGA